MTAATAFVIGYWIAIVVFLYVAYVIWSNDHDDYAT